MESRVAPPFPREGPYPRRAAPTEVGNSGPPVRARSSDSKAKGGVGGKKNLSRFPEDSPSTGSSGGCRSGLSGEFPLPRCVYPKWGPRAVSPGRERERG